VKKKDIRALLPYQAAWIADNSAVKVYEKSRRIGISWTEAADSVIHASRASGANVYYISYNEETTQGFIQDCAFWAKKFQMAASEIDEYIIDEDERGIQVFKIKFPSGHSIQALSSMPRNLRSKGRPGERVILDEFAFHDDQGEMLKAAIAFIMWGGKVRIISTHNGVDNPFNTLINEIKAGKSPYSLHHTDVDEAIEQGIYRRICAINDQKWSKKAEIKWRADLFDFYKENADEELKCIPSRSGGTYLTRSLIENIMFDAPVLQFEAPENFAMLDDGTRERTVADWCRKNLSHILRELPREQPHAFGEDFGRVSDLTVIAPVTITKQLRSKVPFIVELRNVPYLQQAQILKYIVERLPRFFFGALDATGNGAFLAERAAQIFGESRIELVSLNEPWYAANLPKFKAAFEDDMIEIPLDTDVLRDLQSLQVINGIPKLPKIKTVELRNKQKSGKTKMRHGDAAIALALAYYASKMEIPVYEYTAAKRERIGLF